MRVALGVIWLALSGCEPHISEPPVPQVDLPSRPASVLLTNQSHRAPQSAPRSIQLVVLDSFPEALRHAVEDILIQTWQLKVSTLDTQPLPKAAYNPQRKRYRAMALSQHLAQQLGAERGADYILGLTQVDISTTKGAIQDWGIFGIAKIGGPDGVLSSYRLARSARDQTHLQQRVRVMASHEVGHLFGLQHCAEHGCIMRDAEGSIKHVDESHGELGPICRDRLRALR
jgi:archaemetzincin